MFTTKLGSRLKEVSGRHTVLILFAQGVDDRIKDFSVASKFTSGIDLRHLDPSSIWLESQSAFQSLFLNNPLYNAVPRFTVFGQNLSSQKPSLNPDFLFWIYGRIFTGYPRIMVQYCSTAAVQIIDYWF